MAYWSTAESLPTEPNVYDEKPRYHSLNAKDSQAASSVKQATIGLEQTLPSNPKVKAPALIYKN